MADPTTANRGYPQPHAENTLLHDVERLSQAFDMIDNDMALTSNRATKIDKKLHRLRLNTLLNENLFII
jgi:ribosome assembly protein YihI (activator of Der GTPase)